MKSKLGIIIKSIIAIVLIVAVAGGITYIVKKKPYKNWNWGKLGLIIAQAGNEDDNTINLPSVPISDPPLSTSPNRELDFGFPIGYCWTCNTQKQYAIKDDTARAYCTNIECSEYLIETEYYPISHSDYAESIRHHQFQIDLNGGSSRKFAGNEIDGYIFNIGNQTLEYTMNDICPEPYYDDHVFVGWYVIADNEVYYLNQCKYIPLSDTSRTIIIADWRLMDEPITPYVPPTPQEDDPEELWDSLSLNSQGYCLTCHSASQRVIGGANGQGACINSACAKYLYTVKFNDLWCKSCKTSSINYKTQKCMNRVCSSLFLVNVDYNGGTVANNNKTSIRWCRESFRTLVTPIRDGYTFFYWLDSETNEIITIDTVIAEDNRTIKADWTKIATSYKINLSSGTCTNKYATDGRKFHSSTKNQVDSILAEYVDIKKDGYTFNGWYLIIDNEKKTFDLITDAFYVQDKEVEICADWTETVYLFKINLNGGICSDKNANDSNFYARAKKSQIEAELKKYTNVTKDGYIFNGWYVNIDGEKKYISSMSDTFNVKNEITEICADWKKKSFVEYSHSVLKKNKQIALSTCCSILGVTLLLLIISFFCCRKPKRKRK